MRRAAAASSGVEPGRSPCSPTVCGIQGPLISGGCRLVTSRWWLFYHTSRGHSKFRSLAGRAFPGGTCAARMARAQQVQPVLGARPRSANHHQPAGQAALVLVLPRSPIRAAGLIPWSGSPRSPVVAVRSCASPPFGPCSVRGRVPRHYYSANPGLGGARHLCRDAALVGANTRLPLSVWQAGLGEHKVRPYGK